ncbi:hypothetical protein Tcan_00579, partial [Toxocara canis]
MIRHHCPWNGSLWSGQKIWLVAVLTQSRLTQYKKALTIPRRTFLSRQQQSSTKLMINSTYNVRKTTALYKRYAESIKCNPIELSSTNIQTYKDVLPSAQNKAVRATYFNL